MKNNELVMDRTEMESSSEPAVGMKCRCEPRGHIEPQQPLHMLASDIPSGAINYLRLQIRSKDAAWCG